jgi:hypothetical protein
VLQKKLELNYARLSIFITIFGIWAKFMRKIGVINLQEQVLHQMLKMGIKKI